MRQVFISYSRNNLDVVTRLVEDLQAVGVKTWHDQSLTGGQRWWDSILQSIRECDIFVFALSPESWDSEACRSELRYVEQLGKPILPVLVSDGINLNLLSHPLDAIQVTDYRRRDREAGFALARAIYTTPPAPPLPDPLPAPPPVPVSYLSDLKERIDSPETLTLESQAALLFELEQEVERGRSPAEVRDLLLRMQQRDDLLAKVATKISLALKNLDEKAPAQPPRPTPLAPAAPDRPGPNKSAGDEKRAAAGPQHCQRCSAQVPAGARFCGGCGAALPQQGGASVPVLARVTPPDNRPAPEDRSKIRRFMCAPADAQRLIADVKAWLDSEGFDSQQMNTDDGGQLLQIKKRGGWRDYVGMATSLNIVFREAGDTLTVEIGAGKWIDKAAAGTVSLFILWPLAVTAGFGAWEQAKMPERIFDFIGARLVCR